MEVINEAQISTDPIELISTQKSLLDACTCTGNCDDD
jgi:hypothetical protein